MDINSEILNSLIMAFVSVHLILSILWFLVDREARVILVSFLALFSLFITVLHVINGHPWWAGFYALITMFWGIESIGGGKEITKSEEDSEETEADNAPMREPLVLQVTAVAADEPKLQTRKVLCPHCGAPNHVFGRSKTDCAYCGVSLA
jgi:hypothetical protein